MTTFRPLFAATLAAVLTLAGSVGARAETATPEADHPVVPAVSPADQAVTAELSALVGTIKSKLQAGQNTEAALAPELKDFETLRAKYAGEKSSAVAAIGIMEARLYLEVLNDSPKGIAILKEVAKATEGTPIAAELTGVIAHLESKAAAETKLAVGQPFPPFNEQGLDGAPLNLGAYQGKVVLVDFWATWCGPCRDELPNVLAAYKKFHPQGFDIVGISLDESRDKLTSFIEDKGMTWSQYFDGKGWKNKLAEAYGVESIPATFLLDREGRIVARDLRGPALEAKLSELLTAKN